MAGRPRKYQEVDMEKAMKAQIDRACVLFGLSVISQFSSIFVIQFSTIGA